MERTAYIDIDRHTGRRELLVPLFISLAAYYGVET